MKKLIMGLTAATALALASPAAASPAPDMPAVPAVTYLAAPATAPLPAPPVQELEVEIGDNDDGAWYTSPLWLAIGAVALIAIIALVVSGRRGGTTVVK